MAFDRGPKGGSSETQLSKVVKDVNKLALEQIKGVSAQVSASGTCCRVHACAWPIRRWHIRRSADGLQKHMH